MIDKCPTCESTERKFRKLVLLPEDEYCPYQMWDPCKDKWHNEKESK